MVRLLSANLHAPPVGLSQSTAWLDSERDRLPRVTTHRTCFPRSALAWWGVWVLIHGPAAPCSSSRSFKGSGRTRLCWCSSIRPLQRTRPPPTSPPGWNRPELGRLSRTTPSLARTSRTGLYRAAAAAAAVAAGVSQHLDDIAFFALHRQTSCVPAAAADATAFWLGRRAGGGVH